MAGVRFADLQSRPTEFLDCTSLTLDELQQLVSPFAAAFHAPMAAWRLDGKPRTARQLSVYATCPLPTPEDRLFFLLTYVQTYSLQGVRDVSSAGARAQANLGQCVLQSAPRTAARGVRMSWHGCRRAMALHMTVSAQ